MTSFVSVKPSINRKRRKGSNSCKGSSFTSAFRGVQSYAYAFNCRYNRGTKWNAQIQVNGKKLVRNNVGFKNQYLGTYDSEWEAAKRYDKAATELHGERAKLNFPNNSSVLLEATPQRDNVSSPTHIAFSQTPQAHPFPEISLPDTTSQSQSEDGRDALPFSCLPFSHPSSPFGFLPSLSGPCSPTAVVSTGEVGEKLIENREYIQQFVSHVY